MTNITLMRHGPAVENNSQRYILGPSCDPGLTHAGIKQTAELIRTSELIPKAERIIVGPYNRTLETARLVQKQYARPLVIDRNLRECDIGILEGLTHEEAKALHPEEYQVYTNRGDMDYIPGAETGDHLQARVISLLERYFPNETANDLLISHAGVIRFFLNTIYRSPRTTQRNFSYEQLHQVQNPLSDLDITLFDNARSSEVYGIETLEKEYILKRIRKPESFFQVQEKIHNMLHQNGLRTPRLLTWVMRKSYGIQVLDYMPGKMKFDPLSDRELSSVIEEIYALQQVLIQETPNFEQDELNEMPQKIALYCSQLEESPVKDVGGFILNHPNFLKLSRGPQVLVDYDMHKENFVFESETPNKIDYGSIDLAPTIFQPACLFMSFFQLYETNPVDLDKLLHFWPEPLDKKDLLIMMQARAFLGASYFQKLISKKSNSPEDDIIFQRYLNSIKNINTLLDIS